MNGSNPSEACLKIVLGSLLQEYRNAQDKILEGSSERELLRNCQADLRVADGTQANAPLEILLQVPKNALRMMNGYLKILRKPFSASFSVFPHN